MNAKEIFTISFTRPYNANKTYFQNADRNCKTVTIRGREAAEAKLAEIIAAGYPVRRIWDGTGKIVSF